MSAYAVKVGKWIRAERSALRVTQCELAAAIGVSDSTISSWEGAKVAMSSESHARLAHWFRRRRRDLNLPLKAAGS